MAEKKIKRLKNSAQIEFVEKKSVFIGFSAVKSTMWIKNRHRST